MFTPVLSLALGLHYIDQINSSISIVLCRVSQWTHDFVTTYCILSVILFIHDVTYSAIVKNVFIVSQIALSFITIAFSVVLHFVFNVCPLSLYLSNITLFRRLSLPDSRLSFY
jgi:hypothetical protein